MKYFFGFLLGGIFGIIGISLLGPKALIWYSTPPVPELLNCGPASEWAMNRLMLFQSIGFFLVGFLGFWISIRLTSKRKDTP